MKSVTLVAVITAVLALATPSVASNIEILEFGIYSAEVKIPATGSNETMKSAGLANICHVMTTSVVPARDNLQFGFRFRLLGPDVGKAIGLRRIIRWPDHLKPATSPETYVENEQIKQVKVGEVSWTGWTNWQTRPGIWTFQLFDKDLKLAEMSFTVVAKDAFTIQPSAASTCFRLSQHDIDENRNKVSRGRKPTFG
jgi:hypothetical protein